MEPTTPDLPNIPPQWQDAKDVYKYSKQAVNRNLAAIVILGLMSFFVSVIINTIFKRAGSLISELVSPIITGALTLTYIASVRGHTMSMSESLQQAASKFVKLFLLGLLVSLAMLGSFLLLIVPFFFVFPRLVLAPYYLLDQDLGVMEAFRASWHGTKDHTNKVWDIVGRTLLYALLMLTIIGIPFAIYFLVMYSATFAVLYEYLKTHQKTASPSPVQ